MNRALGMLIMVGSLVGAIPLAYSEGDPLAVIYDLDFSLFTKSPRAPWLNDPFLRRPGFATVPADEEKFTLSGILYSETGAVAVVNDQTVRVGDTVGDREVTEIGENFVILSRGGSDIERDLAPAADYDEELDSDLDDEIKDYEK